MFQQLTKHIYCFPCDDYSDRPNIGYIVGEKGALLFDAGSSEKHARQLQDAMRVLSLPQPDYVALSHWHWDHAFGLGAWGKHTIAGTKTNEKLREIQSWSWDDAAMLRRLETGEDIRFCYEMMKREYGDCRDVRVVCAVEEFSDELRIDLGGVTCHLLHVRGPHAEDSVICYVPEDDFVFLGDSNGKDLFGTPWHFDIDHADALVDTLMAIPYDEEKLAPYRALMEHLPFTRCIGGHAPAMTKAHLMASIAPEASMERKEF